MEDKLRTCGRFGIDETDHKASTLKFLGGRNLVSRRQSSGHNDERRSQVRIAMITMGQRRGVVAS